MGLQDSFGELRMVGRAGAYLVAAVQHIERHRGVSHRALPFLDHGLEVDRLALGDQAFGDLEQVPEAVGLDGFGRDLREHLVANIRATG